MKAYVRFDGERKELTIDEATARFRRMLESYAGIAIRREKRRLEIGGIRGESGTSPRFWVGAKDG